MQTAVKQLGHLDAIHGDEPWLAASAPVTFTYTHDASYLQKPGKVALGVVYAQAGSQCLVTDQPGKLAALLERHEATAKQRLEDLAAALGTQWLDLAAPLPLSPVAIPKPWGEEIWFTGIEKRGVSRVRSTPIAWLLDLFAAVLAPSHQGEAPLLLKILAPHPAPNLGDLYFELHQEKVEVYVVTAIDKDAWPQGQGAIRYGFSPDAVAAQGSADAFREAYLAAVQQYEKVRREIDRLLDEARLAKGIAVDETLPAAMHLTLLQAVPETLRAQEEAARAAMYQYTRLVPLALGDAVQVAPGVPHSLQHGVRVVEFQTPHYERQILSFGQKTLTQDGWDTAAALQQATLLAEPPVLPADPAQALSQLADFEAFTLLRLTLGAGETISIKAPHYALALCVAGQVAVARADAGNGGATLGAEEAIYLQESAAPISLRSLGQEGSITLLAYPPGRSC